MQPEQTGTDGCGRRLGQTDRLTGTGSDRTGKAWRSFRQKVQPPSHSRQVLLPQLLEFWHCMHVPPHLASKAFVNGDEHGTKRRRM